MSKCYGTAHLENIRE